MMRTKPDTIRKMPLTWALPCALALLTLAPASAKTLVFCSEGSPENFYPGINTSGTSFDANTQIYSRLVDFERGGTSVVPGLAERFRPLPSGINSVSVYTDESGAYYFPAMASGKYRVWAQAISFGTAKNEVDLSAAKHQDFTLSPLKDFVRQLPGDEILASLPDASDDDASAYLNK